MLIRHQLRLIGYALALLIAVTGVVTSGAALARQAVVTITAAPMSENATWAMMVIGLGMIAMAARRGQPAYITPIRQLRRID